MGLAASNARMLSLNARKSDLEFQGQQVNQQRTILAYETETLFEQILRLRVPNASEMPIHYVQQTDPNTGQQVTVATNDGDGDGLSNEYELALVDYTNEYNRINAQIEIYHMQDRALETTLRNIDSQHQAVQTEIDAVKKVIDKNIEMTFKTFA